MDTLNSTRDLVFSMGFYFSRHRSCPTSPFRPFSKDILPDLPRTRLGKLRHHFHLPRDHELADRTVILGPRDHFLYIDLLPLLHSHKCLGSLPPMCVWDRHDTSFKDVGMGNEHRLESNG